MNLIDVNCYSCGSSDYILYDRENGFNLVKCRKCGLLYVNPRPSEEEISLAVRSGIHTGETELNVTNSFNEKAIPSYLKVLDDLYKPAELYDKSWLDIGCGNGEFLIALNTFTDSRIIVKGSEPNEIKAENARRRQLDVEFIDLQLHDKTYDVISMLNVFSHLSNPLQTLRAWRNLIKKDGELLVETGHSSHLPRKYHAKPYLLPDHLSFASKDIVEELLRKTGFRIINTLIYRSSHYPEITFINLIKQMTKFVLCRRNYLHSFLPCLNHGDMYIRAKKIN